MLVENKNNLNDVQLHLLKMFSVPIEENILLDIKKLLSDYFFNKVVSLADLEWEQRKYNNKIMDNWIFEERQ
jgi:hypothetical protein